MWAGFGALAQCLPRTRTFPCSGGGGDVELVLFLWHMLRDKRKRDEDEAERINGFQFTFMLLISADGETFRGNGNLAPLGKLVLQNCVTLSNIYTVLSRLVGM